MIELNNLMKNFARKLDLRCEAYLIIIIITTYYIVYGIMSKNFEFYLRFRLL